MDKEKRIAELAEILYDFGADKQPNNADYHRADYLINLGYGNIKQAVKEFAKRLIDEYCYVDKDEGICMGAFPDEIRDLFTELYGADD